MIEIVDIGDNCTHCGKDTSFGTGSFVNRIPSTTDTQEGYMCPDCQAVECDTCNQKSLDYWMTDGGSIVCESCIDEILKKAEEYGIVKILGEPSEIEIYYKNNYVNGLCYPHCSRAKEFAKQFNEKNYLREKGKTLSRSSLEHIRSLGYTINVVPLEKVSDD